MSCAKICIDDICRGNRDYTLCGGCYCENCDRLIIEPGSCDRCAPEDYCKGCGYYYRECECSDGTR